MGPIAAVFSFFLLVDAISKMAMIRKPTVGKASLQGFLIKAERNAGTAALCFVIATCWGLFWISETELETWVKTLSVIIPGVAAMFENLAKIGIANILQSKEEVAGGQ